MAKTGRQSFQQMLRLPDGLRDRIKAAADRHGRSMNAEIVQVLEREYPEPWPLEDRLAEMVELARMLKQSVDNKSVDRLSFELEETLRGIASGRITGVSQRMQEIARAKLDEWRQIEAEFEELDATEGMDEEEIRARQLRRDYER